MALIKLMALIFSMILLNFIITQEDHYLNVVIGLAKPMNEN